VLAGGEGRPAGTPDGWFVRPTLFGDVHNQMTIAREEIFGPEQQPAYLLLAIFYFNRYIISN
jgi:hypothetical protein